MNQMRRRWTILRMNQTVNAIQTTKESLIQRRRVQNLTVKVLATIQILTVKVLLKVLVRTWRKMLD